MVLRISFSLVIVSFLLSACGTGVSPIPHAETPVAAAIRTSVKSFESGEYRNLFVESPGKTDGEIREKPDAAWSTLFYGNDDFERVYYPSGEDMVCMMDIGHDGVRSEGMSYGMMIAVQLDKKEEFDRLWKWAKTYMYQTEDPYSGYFAWHCDEVGEQTGGQTGIRCVRESLFSLVA